ncbi:MAG: 5-(carboxyamino)imidazole ribonucleotide synthase [Chthoniobacterales bacterium]|nr:5-(carboxyamino)imidazole ribonucleotide synthase [Chthoniobacterales bacterium]
MSRVYGPGSRIGVMGGGQLGRMFAIAARRMGYRIHIFVPETDSPAGQVADVEVSCDYGDERAVREFARGVDVVTFEFENIPLQTIRWVEAECEVRPRGEVLHITQNRMREKEFLAQNGFPLPVWSAVTTESDLKCALERTGYPAVLKTASFGYDGKGQRKLLSPEDLHGLDLSGGPFVLEAFVPFVAEISVVVARGVDGRAVAYPVCENVHSRHILDVTIVPARIPGDVARRAAELAVNIAHRLELTGVMAVEMFLMADGSILVNELAPRPHNSGHFSFDACVTGQFEQQLRAVCGLPLGSTDLLRPCAMANLLGDLWERGEPDWAAALASGDVKLHLYGKAEPKPGRKMGHLVAFGATPDDAADRVRAAREALCAAR